MQFNLKKTIALVGMMGAGKTAIGTALAKRLGVPFIDSDAAIVEAANMPIAEIFERYGEPFFRDKETEVIQRLLEENNGILSTGGGAFMSARNRDLIAEKGIAMWLKADTDVLWNRVKHKDTRPLLRTANPYQTLESLNEERSPSYAKAGVVVESEEGITIEDMTSRVVETLLKHPEVLETRP